MNYVLFGGRLGNDPEHKTLSSGNELTTFNLAVDQYRGPKVEKDTGWWRVNLWGGKAVLHKHLRKGDPIVVLGKVVQDRVKDGDTTKVFYKVDAQDVFFVGRGGGKVKSSDDGGQDTQPDTPSPFDDGDGDVGF